MKFEIIEDKHVITVDGSIYNSDVLHKCFYWYTRDFGVDITETKEGDFIVILKSNSEDVDSKLLDEKIKRDLLDFKLRDIVSTETKVIRELIIAKAFANFEVDNTIKGEISDPVGFDPNLIS